MPGVRPRGLLRQPTGLSREAPFRESAHSVITSFEPGELWTYVRSPREPGTFLR